MSADLLMSLAPIAQTIISKITTGQQVKPQEQMFVLLYSMAEDGRESKDEMKKLREDFKGLNNCLHELTTLTNKLMAETAFIKGKINGMKGGD